MTAILLALGSSVGYGVSDFLASRVARRVPPVLLVLYSQTLQSEPPRDYRRLGSLSLTVGLGSSL